MITRRQNIFRPLEAPASRKEKEEETPTQPLPFQPATTHLYVLLAILEKRNCKRIAEDWAPTTPKADKKWFRNDEDDERKEGGTGDELEALQIISCLGGILIAGRVDSVRWGLRAKNYGNEVGKAQTATNPEDDTGSLLLVIRRIRKMKSEKNPAIFFGLVDLDFDGVNPDTEKPEFCSGSLDPNI
ncbi:unnamed protein product [Caenorhabditis brenneri]